MSASKRTPRTLLNLTVEVVLRKDLAAMGAVVREVLFRVEVGVGAVVRPVGVVAGGPAAHVAPHRRTCARSRGRI